MRCSGDGGLHRRHAFFDIAGDILDHHNRVIHHKAGGNGQRHQAQVVQTVAQHVHGPARANQRDRHRQTGNDGGAQAVQKSKNHQHHQQHGQQQFKLHVFHGGPYAGGAVAQHIDLDGCRQARLQFGQARLDGVNRGNHIGARLALHVQDDGRRQLTAGRPQAVVSLRRRWRSGLGAIDTTPRAQIHVFGTVDNLRHIGHAHRSTIAVGNDQIFIVASGHQLVVGVDGVRPGRPVNTALGGVGIGRRNRGAKCVQPQAIRRQRTDVSLNPHGRPLAATERNQPHAVDLADFQGQPGIDQVLYLGQRQKVRRDGQR